MDSRRAAQINEHAGSRCAVCGKYGAGEWLGEPVSGLLASAQHLGLTVKLPGTNAVHEKCLRKLKELVKNIANRNFGPMHYEHEP